MTSRRVFLGALGAAFLTGRKGSGPAGVSRPTPSAAQLAWQQKELALFCHFGINTFTDREWGDGSESPAIFNPTAFDADQWVRAAIGGGFRSLVLTAKHHDGFCLWPTETTRHSVTSSPWRDGQGNIVADVAASCRKAGLGFGVYLSPWDRNHPAYGDSPRYNDVYQAQLTELLTRYGPIEEVWFDGANGEGPNGKRQQYNWPRTWDTVRRLQPAAVIFSDAGPDVRWIGNEKGTAGDPCWSTVNPATVPFPGVDGPDIIHMLQHGDPGGSVWRPGESDVSIRPGWFWHPAEDEKVRSAENLLELYASSVGRNSKLLLNVPPTREGLVHPTDAARLAAFHARKEAWLGSDVAETGSLREAAGSFERRWRQAVSFDTVSVQEAIERGQHIARYCVEAEVDRHWQVVSTGTTIGHRKLDRFPAVTATGIRVTVEESFARPRLSTVGVHRYPL